MSSAVTPALSVSAPGLLEPLTIEHLHTSRELYNQLTDLNKQRKICTEHHQALSKLIRKYNLESRFGMGLVYRGCTPSTDTIRLGTAIGRKYGITGMWYKNIPINNVISNVGLDKIYGRNFVLTEPGKFVAYDYYHPPATINQQKPTKKPTELDPAFFEELSAYLTKHNLQSLIALQALTPDQAATAQAMIIKIIINNNKPEHELMLPISEMKDIPFCMDGRQTAWAATASDYEQGVPPSALVQTVPLSVLELNLGHSVLCEDKFLSKDGFLSEDGLHRLLRAQNVIW